MADVHPLRLKDALRIVERTAAPVVLGRVTELTGLVLRATAPGARAGELVEIERAPAMAGDPRRLLAEVVGFRGEEVVLLPLDSVDGVGPDSVVRPMGRSFTIWCGLALLGRVLDGLGAPIDGGPPLPTASGDLVRWPIERPAPAPLSRRRVTSALPVGLRAVDGCLTIGEGQRVGIFAGPGLGKSTLIGQIARHADVDITVIGLIGERGREVRDFVDVQLAAETRRRTVVVCATSEQPPLLRLKAALTATAIAEYFRERGRRVLLLVDSLSRVARAQREVGLAAGEMPARQGYPPSVFALLPRLVERTGQGERGSITAMYAVLLTGQEEEPEDIIADEVRATLDGHIVLSRHLAERGHWPAIDVVRSLSRVMDDLVDGAQRASAGRLRETLAICERQRDLMLLGAYQRGSDPGVDQALQRLPLVEEFLRQRRDEHCSFEETRARLLRLFDT